jgi:exodeoxyribonuclease VII small subunit
VPGRKTKDIDFESALRRLEEIIGKLESGDAKLEDAIKLYTEGIKIAEKCHSQLTDAEKKIVLLKEKSQKILEDIGEFNIPVNEEDDG